jgi:hypothetical protein
MPLGDSYASLSDLKDYLTIGQAKTSQDQALASALDSATEEIERYCNRQFNLATSVSSRVFHPSTQTLIDVDDMSTAVGLVVEVDSSNDGTFGTTVAASDYELYPYSGVVDGQLGWPFYQIMMTSTALLPGEFAFRRRGTVRVTAKWGWTAVPAPVRQACLIMAAETYRMKDAPFGVAGMDTFGIIRVRDNRVASNKLARYVRHALLVG